MALDKRQKRKFKTRLHEFFTGAKRGGLDVFSYEDPKPWEDLVKASMEGKSAYYMTRVEQELLEKKSGEIFDAILADGTKLEALIVRGTGTGEKLVPIIKKANGHLQLAFLFDLSKAFTSITTDRIHSVRPDVNTTEINYDFEAQGQIMTLNFNSLALELGGTFNNIPTIRNTGFPADTMVKRLTRAAGIFSRNKTKQGWLAVTLHTNPDKKKALANYNDPFAHRVALNALYLAEQSLKTEGFFARDFAHKPALEEFGDGNGLIGQNIVLSDETLARLGDANYNFKIEGVPYSLTRTFNNASMDSYLPQVEPFAELAAKAGFLFYDSFPSDDKSMTIVLLKFVPEMIGANLVSAISGKPVRQRFETPSLVAVG